MNYDFSECSLCEAMMTVMAGVRPDFPTQEVHTRLAEMVAEARTHVSTDVDQEQQLEQLMDLFYREWGLPGPAGFTVCLMPCGWIMC